MKEVSQSVHFKLQWAGVCEVMTADPCRSLFATELLGRGSSHTGGGVWQTLSARTECTSEPNVTHWRLLTHNLIWFTCHWVHVSAVEKHPPHTAGQLSILCYNLWLTNHWLHTVIFILLPYITQGESEQCTNYTAPMRTQMCVCYTFSSQ